MTVGGAIGAGVGFVAGMLVGAPLQGAMLGYTLGMMIDPLDMHKEGEIQFQDMSWNTFQHNYPVPIIYGEALIVPEIMFIGNARSEVVEQTQEMGGSGTGGQSQTTYTVYYYADFALRLS